ncbi:MAG: Re/Si-specific NAD(P)(+) transhydrogenase subunit alpha [Deltaproteobacteria bacterium]|nr:Re/Si-specific NAD(P)(+) transhydrogenase subunit alpha [Deltaproteobacteria bacterium]
MRIVVPKEIHPGETRAPVVPATVGRFVKAGAEVAVEAGLGQACDIPDEEYRKAGATIVADRMELLKTGDMVLRLRKPPLEEIENLKKGAIHISFLDPFNEKELIERLARCGVTAISLEMLPRSTIAQKMDALSSQASLAGYAAVILAASRLSKIFPMMTTPAGTIKPARVFVVGAGVAGLQAIATAKRLGAVVEAFDTRPVVEEQVKSLGGKFVKIDIGEVGQTSGGYAKELTGEQIEKQREGMKKICGGADIVITTAQVFGKRAPLIITRDMISGMRPGGVIVDMAVESGGNVEGSRSGEDVVIGGVTIIGVANLPGRVARDASLMFSNNLANLVEDFWDKQAKTFKLDLGNELLKACVVTHNGQVLFGR